jgi:hypothetical protein
MVDEFEVSMILLSIVKEKIWLMAMNVEILLILARDALILVMGV